MAALNKQRASAALLCISFFSLFPYFGECFRPLHISEIMDYSTDILDRSIDVVEVQKKLMSELLDALNTYKSDTVKLESDAFSEFNKKAGELEFCQKGFSSCQEIAQEGNDLIPLTNYLKTKLTTCFIPLKDMLKPLKTRVALAEEQFKKLAKYVKLCKNAKVKVLVLIGASLLLSFAYYLSFFTF
jgi:hypothetical protein